ncbi:MAG: sigma-54 dependent transcriptional regulator [Rhodovibrionaceae bacterium]
MAREILIVDDEADIRMLICGILEDEGYATRGVGDSDAVFEALKSRRPSLIVLDIWLQNSPLDGMEILQSLKEDYSSIPVVMISGHGNIETAVNAIKLGAYDFIEKPFKSDHLLLTVARAVETAELRRENEELRLRSGRESAFIGVSACANAVRQSIAKVAPTGSRVLITGPAGTGKEVAARQLHVQSRRSSGPLVILNCATMHPDRMEVELFGTEGGSGEEGPLIGTFERADNGTLLLDEVADMPLETQGKIVRVLQEQTFTRVGGNHSVQVDVRVIASTNRDLAALIEQGSFREDLFYRLSVVPIQVPALRERRDDIPVLAEHFMALSSEAAGVPARGISDDAIAALQAYDWPGNVRQLRNVVDWLLIMGQGEQGDTIRAEHLPSEISSISVRALGNGDEEIMALKLREARLVFERRYLEAQISRFGGNVSKTADFVGMERSALHRKLKSLGVNYGER